MNLTVKQLELLRDALMDYAYHPNNKQVKGSCFVVEQELLNEIAKLQNEPVIKSIIDVSDDQPEQVEMPNGIVLDGGCDCGEYGDTDKWVFSKYSEDGIMSLYRCRYCGKEVLV